MKFNCYFYLLLICGLLGATMGCNKVHGQPVKNAGSSVRVKMSAEEYLVQRLPLGLSKSNVIACFGKPFLESYSDGLEYDLYNWDNPSSASVNGWDYQVSGFQVVYSNNVIFSWSANHSSFGGAESPGYIKPADKAPGGQRNATVLFKKALVFSFYIVRDSKSSGGQYIDIAAFPQLGYVLSRPDFVAQNLRSVQYHDSHSYSETTNVTGARLVCILAEKDVSLFRRFTEDNVGSRVLITVNGSAIAAPRILTPIDNGVVRLLGVKEAILNDVFNVPNTNSVRGSVPNGP